MSRLINNIKPFKNTFPDLPVPDIARAVILSQKESSPQGPEATEPPHQ